MDYCIKRLFKALLIGRIVSSRNTEVFEKKAFFGGQVSIIVVRPYTAGYVNLR